MRLTIVGCAGSFPGPDSAASSYLLEAEHEGRTWRLVIDLGNGALGQLQRYCDPRDVDGFALSHLHPDHCIDMASWAVLSKYHPHGAYDEVPVYSPKGALDYLGWAGGPGGERGDTGVRFVEWDSAPVHVLGPFRILPARVDHPVPAYGMRIEVGDHVLAYSGDSGPVDALVDLARGADLFLCEASFVESAENPPHLHLTGAEAGSIAVAAGAKHLLITHIPAWTDRDEVESDLATTWSGGYDVVGPGETYEV